MKPTLPLTLTLAACATHTLPAAGPPSSLDDGIVDWEEHQAMEEDLAASLDRLDALDLLNVGDLVLHAPEASSNCYGPCYDAPEWQDILTERATQIHRLERFVSVAEDIHEQVDTAVGFQDFDAQQALEQLNALEIIDFESIDWEMSGNCYVSLCPEDSVRRARISRLIASTTSL